MAVRGNRKSRDARNALVAIPGALYGRLTARRPGTAHHWLEHEAALVQEDHAPTPLSRVFLYAATAACARPLWPARRAPLPAALASDSSSPALSICTRRGLCGGVLENISRLPRLLAPGSTGLYDSRAPRALVEVTSLTSCARGIPTSASGQDGVSPVIPPLRLVCTSPSNGEPSLAMPQRDAQPLADRAPLATEQPPDDVASLVLLHFLLVSCTLYRQNIFVPLAKRRSIILVISFSCFAALNVRAQGRLKNGA